MSTSQERYDKAASYLERSAAKDNYYAAYTLGKLYQEQFNDNALAEKNLQILCYVDESLNSHLDFTFFVSGNDLVAAASAHFLCKLLLGQFRRLSCFLYVLTNDFLIRFPDFRQQGHLLTLSCFYFIISCLCLF